MKTLREALAVTTVAVRPTSTRGTLRAVLTRYTARGHARTPVTFLLARGAGWSGPPSAERVLGFLHAVAVSVADDFPLFHVESGMSRDRAQALYAYGAKIEAGLDRLYGRSWHTWG